MLRIFVDADACPVKEEVYRVARRYELPVSVVANARMRVPNEDSIDLVIVPGDFDAADDWIVEQVGRDDIVVTADIPLAARCLEKEARVLDSRGRPFSEDSIGDLLASRDLMSQLRESGVVTGGPPPFSRKDRSQFLQGLDKLIQAVRLANR